MKCETIFCLENSDQASILKAKCEPVLFPLGNDMKQLIEGMQAKLIALGGVGLAAPQVGQPYRIIVVRIGELQASIRNNAQVQALTVFINADYELIEDGNTNEDWEGCFSVTDFMAKIERPVSIRLKAQDIAGNHVDQIVEGFLARVLQHEIDHLNGILIRDRLVTDTIQGPSAQMMALRMKELTSEQRTAYEALIALLSK